MVYVRNETKHVRSQKLDESKATRGIFVFFLIPHLLAAILSPIQDCDEVFNYWEPSHYLNHGYGFQTWEYSPEYAIRSWAYAGLHSGFIAPAKFIAQAIGSKSVEFFILRAVLGVLCASSETRLFNALYSSVSPRIAAFFMLIMVSSSGMFHAATAYLPSSFAMYTTMLGAAEFIDWREGKGVPRGIMAFAMGAIIGWPFAGILIVPFAANDAIQAISSGTITSFLKRTFSGILRSIIVLVSDNRLFFSLSNSDDVSRAGRQQLTGHFTKSWSSFLGTL